jgi:hypothetical protein
MNYPRMVYRTPGPNPVGAKSFAHESVADDAALAAALADGWFASLPEALDPPAPAAPVAAPVVDDNAPPTRAEMEAQAARMGIDVDRRWSDKTLLDKIDAALKADEGL